MKAKIKTLTDLLKKLGEDPKIKEAIDKLKEKSKDGAKHDTHEIIRTVSGLLVAVLALSRRTNKITAFIEAAALLISLSIILKKNLFDRPEVQEFFRENWASLKKTLDRALTVCRTYANEMIKKAKSVRQ